MNQTLILNTLKNIHEVNPFLCMRIGLIICGVIIFTTLAIWIYIMNIKTGDEKCKKK